MPSLAVAKGVNAAYNPAYVPVVVITGATSGIGQALTATFARYLKGRVHIVLIGRNQAAAESIISSLPAHSDQEGDLEVRPTYEFISCDLTLMKNAHDLARNISDKVPKINFLVHSAGVVGFKGRLETKEGIDRKLAVRYYARWVLTNDLLPLLKKAKAKGEPGSVLSILAPGYGSKKISLDDLGLKHGYTGMKALLEGNSYNDLMVAEFSSHEPLITFAHVFPGSVDTPLFQPSNTILRLLSYLVVRPLMWLVGVSTETCAEYLLFGLLSTKDKGGTFRRNETGDDIGMKDFPDQEGAREKLWAHTVEVTRVEGAG